MKLEDVNKTECSSLFLDEVKFSTMNPGFGMKFDAKKKGIGKVDLVKSRI